MSGRYPGKYGNRRRSMKQRLAHRDGGWLCAYCGRKLTPVADARRPIDNTDPNHPTVDHVVPKSKGGSYVLANLVLSCTECNQDRAAEASA